MYSIHFNNNPLRVRKLHKDSFVNYICFPRFLRKRECDVNTRTLLVKREIMDCEREGMVEQGQF